jgi:Flp pilus assembly protein TadD
VRIALPAVLAAVLAAVAVAAATGAFARFAQPPRGSAASSPGAIASHLLSANGSGRAQLWSAALRQFADAPLGGGGAGSYEVWWARHASIPVYVRNPHSLYLQELGELGVPGLLLVLVALGAVLVPLARRLAGDAPVELEPAVAGAVVAAWALAAAYDWVWQLPAVSAIGVAALGLAATWPSALDPAPAPGEPRFTGRAGSVRAALRPAALALCVLLAVAQLVPWLAARRVDASRSALAHGDAAAALTAAYDATTIEPWSPSAYEQLAAAAEGAGRLGVARAAIATALRRDPSDWQAWLERARIALARGDVAGARAALRRARNLAPRLTLNL